MISILAPRTWAEQLCQNNECEHFELFGVVHEGLLWIPLQLEPHLKYVLLGFRAAQGLQASYGKTTPKQSGRVKIT